MFQISLLLLLTLLLTPSAFAVDETRKLFEKSPEPMSKFSAARHTVIVWANSDSDQFVDFSGQPLGKNGKVRIRNAHGLLLDEIQSAAEKNREVNVVFVQDLRGTDRWYTRKSTWGANLKVWARGQLIHTRSVQEVNTANPDFLQSLVRFSTLVFPYSQLHLVFRGHHFSVNEDETFFDLSHPTAKYSINKFSSSLASAAHESTVKKSTKSEPLLATITFASCSMAYWQVAQVLAPYAKYLIASPVTLLQRPPVGFSFGLIRLISDDWNSPKVARAMGSLLLSPFEKTDDPSFYKMEYPTVILGLSRVQFVMKKWGVAKSCLIRLPAAKELSEDLLKNGFDRSLRAVKTVSERFLNYQRDVLYKSEVWREKLTNALVISNPDSNAIDLNRFLQWLEKQQKLKSCQTQIKEVRQALNRVILKRYNFPSHGLSSVLLSDFRLFPRL